ncbi:hypothetical protein TL18_05730 [Methanobrevibacter sp. YE315]|uniref:hypothetical protein n=1 Tax=Methanobrevibacter sp. YE315 TaxID=1609968 RepID=UPI000764E9AC|nr:hypothetical protein [Methanobrevibacter sp. YE315]AMD17565.1 hypothetical protein TL18_05730 [Methanobrevibacter sp. YE315]
MELKLAIIYGILIWILSYIISMFNPVFTDNLAYVNIVGLITMIIIIGFFGILYIRNIESNEVIEGIIVGIIFIIVHFICDLIFTILPNYNPTILENYIPHILSMAIMTLIITTSLGYFAQMNVDLK